MAKHTLRRAAIRQPNFQWPRHATLPVALGHLRRPDEAGPVLSDLCAQRPDFSVAFAEKHHLISNPDRMALYLDGLCKAGVPEASGRAGPAGDWLAIAVILKYFY